VKLLPILLVAAAVLLLVIGGLAAMFSSVCENGCGSAWEAFRPFGAVGLAALLAGIAFEVTRLRRCR
jgi:hypothetical protein